MSDVALADIPPVKDPERAHPVATVWRPVFCDIVRAFAGGDFSLGAVLPHVAVIDETALKQIKGYVEQYGEALAELPHDSWSSSVSQWMGSHWDVLVDLWTAESGRSDLVLSAHVSEEGEGYRFRIEGIYVP